MIYAICFIIGFICCLAIILPIAILKVKQEIAITDSLVDSLLTSLDDEQIENMIDIINENVESNK